MNENLPLDKMLSEKGDAFRDLFIKTMNLYLGSSIGRPIADNDKVARVQKLLEDAAKKSP